MKTKNKKIGFDQILFFAGIASLLVLLIAHLVLAPKPDMNAYLQQVFPTAASYTEVNKDPLVYTANVDNQVIGYAVLGQGSGYQSTVQTLTGINLDGTIADIAIVSQQETPTFFARLSDKQFFKQFKGQEIARGFGKDNIDAVANATLSSNAVMRGVNEGAYFVGKTYLNLEVPSPYAPIRLGGKEIFLILMMLFAVIASFLKKNKMRYVVMMISVVALGFYFNAILTYTSFTGALTGNSPIFSENAAWYILLYGAIAMILLTGKNLFCVWLCPFGAIQELLGKLCGIAKLPSHKVHKIMGYIPGFLAWFSFAMALIIGDTTAVSYEPFATLFSQVGTSYHWVVLPVVLGTSIFISRFWCQYFCPVGYALGLIMKGRRRVSNLWKKRKTGVTT